ncbi:MAG TPA: protein kinase, partial [Acidimicrobiia bacterium]|nr:protein kinase [Acidimicrobiia bacterium]
MPETVVPGRVLGGRYRLNHELARGGMATVWVAEDPLLSRRVAVKILHPELAVNEALRTRFRHEAVTAAKLSHPAIVATYDTGDDEGTAYIVMQLVEGPTLRRMLDARGALPVGEAADIAGQVAEALDHAHRHGLVHRDIKPANVLIPPDGQVKVTDFGIAKAAGDEDLTSTGAVIGTARYLAPEQVNGDAVDGRADVYALGLILYEMLTGTLPFSGDSEIATAMARLTKVPDPVRKVRPEVPPMLDAVVNRSLARDPDHRFPSARALHDALDPARDSTPPPVTPPPGVPVAGPADHTVGLDRTEAEALSPPPEARVVTERRWPRALVGVLVGAAVVAAGYFGVRALTGGGDDGGGGAANADAANLTIVNATDFDPDGDDQENGDTAAQATDGNPTTVWSTERYNNRDFDDPKRGVGLVLELEGDQSIGEVEVAADAADWNGEIYVADASGASLEDWGTPVAQRDGLGRLASFDLRDGVRGRFVLV